MDGFHFTGRWASSAQARRGQRAAGWNGGGSGGMRWDGPGKSPSHPLRAEENSHVCVPEIETPHLSAALPYPQILRRVMQSRNKCYEWCHFMSQLLCALWDEQSRCDYILSWWCVISAGRLDTIWWCHVVHVITIMDSCLYSWWTICKYISISVISLSISVDWYVVLWLMMWFYMSLRLFLI